MTSDDPRARLLQAGVELTDRLPLTKVFAGTTSAAVADAAGVTTGSFFHHFRTQAEFVDAMVLAALPTPEDLGEQVDELVDSLDHIDLLEVLRASLKDTWEVHSGEPDIQRSQRFQSLLIAHHDASLSRPEGDMTTVGDVLRTSYRIRHDQAVRGWARLLEMTGRTFVAPFDIDRIAIALTALFEGLLLRHQFDPEAADDELFSDISAALATALTIPKGSRVRLADLVQPAADRPHLSPQARSGARRRRATRARITDAATGMFGDGWESVTALEVADAAGVSHQTVLNLFGGTREVAASTFVRHIADLSSASEARVGEPPMVTLHRVLGRLADLAAADPEPARALLEERLAAKLHHGGDLPEMDIRLEVPVAQCLLGSVERLDLGGTEPIQVVALLCDTVLSLALDRVVRRDDPAALAMQLLPASATGVEPWAPLRPV